MKTTMLQPADSLSMAAVESGCWLAMAAQRRSVGEKPTKEYAARVGRHPAQHSHTTLNALRTPLAARTARQCLDMRVPNLQDDLPALVETYRKTRVVVDAGHRPKSTA